MYGPDWNFEMWDSNETSLKLSKSLEEARARNRTPEKKDKEEKQDEDSES